MSRSMSHPPAPPPVRVNLPEAFVPCTECRKHYIIRNQVPRPAVCARYYERDLLDE